MTAGRVDLGRVEAGRLRSNVSATCSCRSWTIDGPRFGVSPSGCATEVRSNACCGVRQNRLKLYDHPSRCHRGSEHSSGFRRRHRVEFDGSESASNDGFEPQFTVAMLGGRGRAWRALLKLPRVGAACRFRPGRVASLLVRGACYLVPQRGGVDGLSPPTSDCGLHRGSPSSSPTDVSLERLPRRSMI